MKLFVFTNTILIVNITVEVELMEYMTAREAAQKWNITVRRVQVLCSQGRIQGAMLFGNIWEIPKNSLKPEDMRRKKE